MHILFLLFSRLLDSQRLFTQDSLCVILSQNVEICLSKYMQIKLRVKHEEKNTKDIAALVCVCVCVVVNGAHLFTSQSNPIELF